jgi:hypothetical protein
MRCLDHSRYFYKMFRMNPDIVMALRDLLVSYGLKSTHNVTSIESLQCFYGLLEGHSLFPKLKTVLYGPHGQFT